MEREARTNRPAEQPPSGDRRLVGLVCTLLLLAVGLVFGQTVRHGFINMDDAAYVYANPRLADGLTAKGIYWALTSGDAGNWHPLTWVSHILDWQLYGRSPGGHHLTNVLLHAASAVLLLLVLRQMSGELWPSAFVAALFAIHPLRVESVAWVAERKDVLSGLFFVLTLGAYARYVVRPRSWMRYAALLVVYGFGLMSKPMLVTLPFVLLLLDYWPLGRIARVRETHPTASWRLVVEKIPLLTMAAASCVLTVWAQGKAVIPTSYLAFPWRIGNAVVSYAVYLGQIIYPADLAAFYPHLGPKLPVWQIAAASCALLAITALVAVFRRRCPYFLVGWLWYLGTLVPVIGLVQVAGQARADRYTYLTQIGLYAAAAWGLAAVCRGRRLGQWLCGLGGGLALAALMVCAWRQTSLWRDSETLWRHTLKHTRANALAHNNLAIALKDEGKSDEAIAQWRKALEIEPKYVEVRNSLAIALAKQGKFDEAMGEWRKVLKIRPNYVMAHNNLGIALMDQGRLDEAVAEFREALKIRPDFAAARDNLVDALYRQGKFDEATAEYRKAPEVKPHDAGAGDLLDVTGRARTGQ